LNNDETIRLIKLAHEGDKGAIGDIIEGYGRMVYKIVNENFENKYVADNYDDALQEGFIGLFKAIKDFQIEREVKFSTYAYHRINGHLKIYFREEYGKPMRISRGTKDKIWDLYKLKNRWLKEYGRDITNKEISQELNISHSELGTLLIASEYMCSMDDIVKDDECKSTFRRDLIADKNMADYTESIECRMDLYNAISELNDKHKKVIYMRFFYGKTQTEVGEIIGKSQMTAGRVEKAALKELREKLGECI